MKPSLQLITAAAIGALGVLVGNYFTKGNVYLAVRQDPPAMTNAQYRRVLQGYVRDHTTHQWFKSWTAVHDDGCKADGTVIDATFTDCRHPLTGGLPDLTD